MARPEKEIDIERMKEMASKGATLAEMAKNLGIGHATLERRLAKNPKYWLALEEARGRLCVSLRSKQVEKALGEGNVTMLIWLGKQYLGQKDKFEHAGTGEFGAIEITHAIQSPAERILAELRGIAARTGTTPADSEDPRA